MVELELVAVEELVVVEEVVLVVVVEELVVEELVLVVDVDVVVATGGSACASEEYVPAAIDLKLKLPTTSTGLLLFAVV